MTTAYITHADCLRHEMGAGHPERPDRLSAINEHLRASGLLEELRCLEAPLADAADLERVHLASYVDADFRERADRGLSAARSRYRHESVQPCRRTTCGGRRTAGGR